jgi:TPP-dependent pyruvate/acetoin dehydrogenase alpha subunit
LVRFQKVLIEDKKTATGKDFADIDRMTKEYAAKEADLAVEEPMPDPDSVARGVYAGDDYAVPKVELVTSPFAGKGSSA